MAFKTFDQKVYFALEASAGDTFTAPDATTGYIETTQPTWSIVQNTFERDPTRDSITPVPLITPGSSDLTAGSVGPSATVEFSFSVELNGEGTAATPRWSRLLSACGLSAIDGRNEADSSGATTRQLWSYDIDDLVTGATSSAPTFLFHKENISRDDVDTTYGAARQVGRVIGDVAFDDGELFFAHVSNGGAARDTLGLSPDNIVVGSVSGNRATATVKNGRVGSAWVSSSVERPGAEGGDELGGGPYSSLSMEFVINKETEGTGTVLQARGCRGNVEWQFVSGDRVLMAFNFQGVLHGYKEDVAITPQAEGRLIPPAFVGASMTIQDSSSGAADADAVSGLIFNAVTINLNNELVVRENPNSVSGYDQCYITGRNPQMTWNPDAVLQSGSAGNEYAFWSRFLIGETSRVLLNVGTDAGNKFLFKLPAIQFTGIAEGDRDSVVVYDTTSTATGGEYGSSVAQIWTDESTLAGGALSAKMGVDNEFVLYSL